MGGCILASADVGDCRLVVAESASRKKTMLRGVCCSQGPPFHLFKGKMALPLKLTIQREIRYVVECGLSTYLD